MMVSASTFAGNFTSNECLKSSFEASVKHDGKFFGLIKNKLDIKKEECLITVTFDNILETKWKIDLCRQPIHMKFYSKGSESVYKRNTGCRENDTSKDFCVYRKELEATLQDYGLIYAKGERESLNTDHGKTFCSYLLIQQYLDKGVLFSKYKDSVDLFHNNKIQRKGAQIRSDIRSKTSGAIESATSPVPSSTQRQDDLAEDQF